MISTPRSVSAHATSAQLNAWRTVPDDILTRCDVAVVGGGIGGVCAAIAAARRGITAVLVEESHMLGGQATTSGVSAMDVTYFYRQALTHYGLWGEITERIERVYREELRRPANVCRYRNDSFGPNVIVVERVLTEMVAEAGVTCLRNARVVKAERLESATRLHLNRGTVVAGVIIDATEDGSVIGLLGYDHRIGNTTVINGKPSSERLDRVAIQDITQVAVIRKYPEGEMPAWARLSDPPPLYDLYRDEASRAYPDAPGHQKVHPNGFAGYRAVPDLSSDVRYRGADWEVISRTSLNYHNDQAVFADYLTSADARRDYEYHALLRTLAIIYYLQNELELPWGVVDDEGFGDSLGAQNRFPELSAYTELIRHLPPRPYIRESRRIIGRDTLTGKDIYRIRHRAEARWNTDCIAVGTYPPDLHGGRKPENLESELSESLEDKPKVWREGPFAIPLGCLVPAGTGGLIAAEKNLSASRIAAGAVRLHPTVAATGEAAGTLSALASVHGAHVNQVPTLAVQISLIEGGALLAPMSIGGIDREHPDFVPITLAVCRQLVERETVRSTDQSVESYLRVDLAAAARRGMALMDELRPWSVPVRQTGWRPGEIVRGIPGE